MNRIQDVDAQPVQKEPSYKPVDVNKDQIREVIERLKSLGYFNAFDPTAISRLNSCYPKFLGREIKFSINEEGFYQVGLDNGQICIYEARVILVPVKIKGSMYNVSPRVRIANSQDLLPDDLEFCTSFVSNVVNVFRQTLMFEFICSLDEEATQFYVKNLDSLKPIPKIENK
jgi:hypothetical protein